MKRNRGFTLIELLVVISIIALLLAILMPSLTKAREQARRQTCLSRVKQQVLGLNMYSNDNDGKMPLPNTAGGWLQDVAINTVHFMFTTGMTREMFYCPSNSTHQRQNDLFWLFNNRSWDPQLRRFTNESGFIVSGYCFLLQTTRNNRPQIVSYPTDSTKKQWVKSSMDSMPSSKELVIDSIMGVPRSNLQYGRNFLEVPGGIYSSDRVYDRTSHVGQKGIPSGGNIGFLDGHGEWRAFDPLVENGVAVPRYADNPGFFW